MNGTVSQRTLEEMVSYYRARAAEYDEWWYRQGRFDRGSAANALWFAEMNELFAALDALNLRGDVLELASGTGIWTERLVGLATTIMAVDASPEMIAINKVKVGSDRVTYTLADLFTWRPARQYDAIVFCFWISHIPLERLDTFLRTVTTALSPGGKLFFADGRREPTSTAVDHQLPEAGSQTMTRRLNDGRTFEIVKNYYEPAALAARCQAAGLDVTVKETATYFLYGVGSRK